MKNLKFNHSRTRSIQLLLCLLMIVTFYPTTEANAQRISSGCTSNNNLDVKVLGIHNASSKTIPGLSSKVKRVIVECTCRAFREPTCPSSITFTVNGSNVSVPRSKVDVYSTWEGNGEPEGDFYVYRLVQNKSVTSLKYNAPASSSDREGMRGLTAWIVNNDAAKANQPQSIYIDEFHYQHPARSFDIPIKAANAARNMTIHLPVSEIQGSGFTRYRAVALNASGTVVATRGNKDFKGGNNASEIRWDKLAFNGVPASATKIRVWIESPEESQGTSFMIGSVAVTSNQQKPTLTCPAAKTVACASEIQAGDATFTPACPDDTRMPTVSGPVISGPENCPGTTYTFTHSIAGLSCKQVFTIQNTAPSFSCSENIQVSCATDIDSFFPEYSVSCVGEVVENVSEPIIDGEPDCASTIYAYTYTVTDACGRSTSCVQVFMLDAECTKDCSCNSNLKSSIEIAGIHNNGNIIDISLDENVVKVIAESTCRGFRGSTCPASITYTVNGENVTVIGTPIIPFSSWVPNPPGTSEGDFVMYRLVENKPLTSLQYNPPPLQTDQQGMRGLTTFITSEDAENANNAASVVFDNFLFRIPERCKNILINQAILPRDITIHIPVSEIQNNPSRYTRYRAEALDANGNVLTILNEQLFNGNNEASEIRLDALLFKNVPAEATSINVCVESPLEDNIIGTSFIVGSIMLTSKQEPPTIICPEGGEVACADDIEAGVAIVETICPDETIFAEVEGPIIVGEANCPGTTYTYIYSYGGVSCEQVFTIADLEDRPCICETGLCSLKDWQALKALYENTDGDNWKENDGWEQIKGDRPPANCDLSMMHGVTLNDNGSVEVVKLYNNNLVGILPPELGDLCELTALYLASGSLSGAIPKELGKLKKLEKLFLSGNTLSGSIPPELGQLTNLNDLRLDGNQLSGEIPIALSNLINLTYLGLTNNQFSGTIPVWLNLLSQLYALCLADNQLTGKLPAELGALNYMRYLSMHNNSLSGCYAPSLDVLCTQLYTIHNKELDFNNGNNLDATWKEFCTTGIGACNNFRLSNVDYSLFPNPSTGKVSIHFNKISEHDRTINIYDNSGKLYQSVSYKGMDKTVELDLSKLPKGIYIVEVQHNFHTQTEKLVLH